MKRITVVYRQVNHGCCGCRVLLSVSAVCAHVCQLQWNSLSAIKLEFRASAATAARQTTGTGRESAKPFDCVRFAAVAGREHFNCVCSPADTPHSINNRKIVLRASLPRFLMFLQPLARRPGPGWRVRSQQGAVNSPIYFNRTRCAGCSFGTVRSPLLSRQEMSTSVLLFSPLFWF